MATTSDTLPKRAGIYCRLSYAPDGSVEKVERQEGDCRDLAARLGWPVSEAHILTDNSRSAWQRKRKRPGWDQLLAAVEKNEIDAIIVYHGDRLIRQPYDLEKLISIADMKGIRIASVSGTRDLDSTDDRFVLRIEAAQACRESDNTSRRVKRGVKARVARGVGSQAGKRAYGWGVPTGEVRLKVNPETGEMYEVPALDMNKVVPEEAEILVEVVERILAGLSLAGAVRWMNERSTTTQGNPWRPTTLRRALTSPRMAGIIEYGGAVQQAVWGEIIPQDTWEDLKAVFAANAVIYPYYGKERKHLLTGIAECSDCEVTMWAKPVTAPKEGRTSRIYFCRECGRGRNEVHLDAFVQAYVVRLLNNPRFREELDAAEEGQPNVGAEIAVLERRRAEAKSTLENLADHPDADASTLAMTLGSFDRKITELRGRLSTTARSRLLRRMAGISREEWEDEPIDVRSATVQALVRVLVKPVKRRGPGFDTESVDIRRKHLSPGSQ